MVTGSKAEKGGIQSLHSTFVESKEGYKNNFWKCKMKWIMNWELGPK